MPVSILDTLFIAETIACPNNREHALQIYSLPVRLRYSVMELQTELLFLMLKPLEEFKLPQFFTVKRYAFL